MKQMYHAHGDTPGPPQWEPRGTSGPAAAKIIGSSAFAQTADCLGGELAYKVKGTLDPNMCISAVTNSPFQEEQGHLFILRQTERRPWDTDHHDAPHGSPTTERVIP